MFCIMNSLMTTMWGMVLLFMVMYLFAIVCIQGAVVQMRGDPEMHFQGPDDAVDANELRGSLEMHYRSLPRALLSVVMCISGGMDWYDIAKPLMNIHWVYIV